MNELEIIENIHYLVWGYDPFFDEKRQDVDLVKDLKTSAKLIQIYAKAILEDVNDKDNVAKYSSAIEKIVYGEILPENKNRRLRAYPEFISTILLHYCDLILKDENS